MHTFPYSISAMRNANSLVQDLNLGCWAHFPFPITISPLHHKHLSRYYVYIYIYIYIVYMIIYIWLYIYIYIYQVTRIAQRPSTLFRHPSLTFIAPDWHSRLHPVSTQSWCLQVFDGRPTLARPCVGVHKRTSLMNSSLLLQQCPACLVHLTWMVWEMGGRWPYNCCFMVCCFQDLFKTSYI